MKKISLFLALLAVCNVLADGHSDPQAQTNSAPSECIKVAEEYGEKDNNNKDYFRSRCYNKLFQKAWYQSDKSKFKRCLDTLQGEIGGERFDLCMFFKMGSTVAGKLTQCINENKKYYSHRYFEFQRKSNKYGHFSKHKYPATEGYKNSVAAAKNPYYRITSDCLYDMEHGKREQNINDAVVIVGETNIQERTYINQENKRHLGGFVCGLPRP